MIAKLIDFIIYENLFLIFKLFNIKMMKFGKKVALGACGILFVNYSCKN
jgi:hypothetical protein